MFKSIGSSARHLVAPMLLVALTGCGNKSTGASDSLSVSQAEPQNAQACGASPSGNYTAQQILATEVTGEFQGLYEGPVWVNDALYYSHFSFERGFPSRILRLKDGEVGVMVKSSGSNGLALDAQGNLIAASHAVKGLLKFDRHSGDQSILVDSFEDNPFNSPNDLVFTSANVAYFTDPDFQKSAAPGGQPVTGVYQFIGEKVTLIDSTIRNPNGIALSPDQTKLYVAGGMEQGFLREYTLENDRVIAQRNLVESVTIPDGLAVDCRGNIYVTEHTEQRVRVFSSAGEEIATIKTNSNVTNAAFGGSDGKTLFLTGAGTLWTLALDVTAAPKN